MFQVVVLIALFAIAECRLQFTYSEFLDGNDLKLVAQTDFGCSKGCMVYSPTENANLAILNKVTGIEVTNLNSLANNGNANDRSYLYGWTLPPATYTLKSKNGLTGPIFSLYIVSNEAPHYGQSLRVADPYNYNSFSTTAGIMTIMTRGTGIRMVNLNSDSEMTPKVFATGYDATNDDCFALYNANSLSHAQQSQIDVIGPIATIRFDGLSKMTSASVKVSGDVMNDASELRNSLTISSPGYHGCPYSRFPSLYQYNMNSLNRRFRSDLNQGVIVRVRSKTWISVESDALLISGLQDQTLKLMGEQTYQHDFPVAKVDIQLAWQRTNQNSNFAVELDATKSAAATSLLLAIICTFLFSI